MAMFDSSKLLKIDDIEIRPDLYPRTNTFYGTVYRYLYALESGAVFPPIVVASLNGKFILVDGRHRMEATKMHKEGYIKANILKGLDERGIFAEAVRLNIQHGECLSPYEKAVAIDKLQKMKFSMEDISKLTQIPLHRITGFMSKRMTSSITGETVILKAPFRHLAGKNVDKNIDFEQQMFNSSSQMNLINQLISLLENKTINSKDEKIMEKLKYLRRLISKL